MNILITNKNSFSTGDLFSFSPDGKILASSSEYRTIILWTVESGEELHRFDSDGGGKIKSISFSPDGKILASSHEYGTIILWNCEVS